MQNVNLQKLIQDPVTQFQSLFNYVHEVNDDFRLFPTVEKYLDSRLSGSSISQSPFSKRFSRNSVSKAFGYLLKKDNIEKSLNMIQDRQRFDIKRWRIF